MESKSKVEHEEESIRCIEKSKNSQHDDAIRSYEYKSKAYRYTYYYYKWYPWHQKASIQ